jgi:hypothetical protein
MKRPDKIWINTGIISIVFFALGKLMFTTLFGFFEPNVDGIAFRIRELDRFVSTSTLFSMMFAVIPFAIVFIWQVAPVVSTIRRIISVIIPLLFMIAGIVLRHYQVKNYFTRVVKPYFLAKGQLHVDYPIDPLNFVFYMSAGFCIGLVLSWLFLKQKIRRKLKYSDGVCL